MMFVDLLMWLSPAGHDRLAASIPISLSRPKSSNLGERLRHHVSESNAHTYQALMELAGIYL
jgi:hypothetical protein